MKLILFDYNYLPYEIKFLKKEIVKMGGKVKSFKNKEIEVVGLSLKNASKLTYIKYVVDNNETFETLQSLREQINGKAQRISQSTRYGPHGLHEYKGKFNPQTPRSLLLQNFKKGAKILDPFMGSGTTLIEALDLEMEAYGVELNPFAFEIAKAKLLFEHLDKLPKFSVNGKFQKSFSTESENYLSKWFTRPQYKDLIVILGTINKLPVSNRLIPKIVLSDQIRKNSLQDPRDLRIRRRKNPPTDSSLLDDFIDKYNHIVDVHKRWKELYPVTVKKDSNIYLGDSTKLDQYITVKIDGTVCSPPYFSALPYVDTYRLSMVSLELIDPKSIMTEERKLIGARDITKQEKDNEYKYLNLLPSSINKLVMDIQNLLAQDKSAGFRKRAVPFNLIRYCRLMQSVLKSLYSIEKKGALNLWIIGSNRVVVNNKDIIIDTPDIVSKLAKSVGFKKVVLDEVDAYSRYDLHSKNSIKREMVLKFSK